MLVYGRMNTFELCVCTHTHKIIIECTLWIEDNISRFLIGIFVGQSIDVHIRGPGSPTARFQNIDHFAFVHARLIVYVYIYAQVYIYTCI